MKYKQKGFTLIELLVVIAIIGVLAGVLFVAINPAEQTLKTDAAKVAREIKSIRKSIVLTESDTGNIVPSGLISTLIANGDIKYLPNTEILSTLDAKYIYYEATGRFVSYGIKKKTIKIRHSASISSFTDHDREILKKVHLILNKSNDFDISYFPSPDLNNSYTFVVNDF